LYPVLLKLGPLEIKSYGVMLAVSFLVGYFIAQKRAKARGIDQAVLLDLSFYILLSAIVGSRAFYVFTHRQQFSDNPLNSFSIWEGGLSMMGGVLLSLLVSFYYLKAKRIEFKLIADIIAPSVALGIGLTRIGCFLYGCCYGLPTTLFWGVHFPLYSAAGAHFHESIHPTQLYSSAYGFLIFLILLLIDRAKPAAGVLSGALLAFFAPARFAVDFFRYYEPEQYVLREPVALTNNQLICIFLFILGVYVIITSRKAKKKRA